VQIRVGEGAREAAIVAPSAWPPILGGAEKRLGEPHRETLLADAARTLKEEARREGPVVRGAEKATAEVVVAVQGYEGHARNLARRPWEE
jgi:hypothetical protein